MPKRKRRDAREFSETSSEEFEVTFQKLPVKENFKIKQPRKKASRSVTFNVDTSPTKHKNNKVVSTPSVFKILESSFSSENSDVPNAATPQPNQCDKDLQSLLSLSANCKERLMRVVSTAIQFQRHSHQPKLCSSHFSKALALDDLNLESDDSDDFQVLSDSKSASKKGNEETKKQPILCHGRWLNHS